MIQRFDEHGEFDPEGPYVLFADHQAQLKSVLDRESATQARHDKRVEELEAAAAEGLRNKQVSDYLARVPTASWPWRLPVIRWVRAWWYAVKIHRHYEWYLSMGQLPVYAHLDQEVVRAIWRGEK